MTQTIYGLAVSPGSATGPALLMPEPVPEPDPALRLAERERPDGCTRLRAAVDAVQRQLSARARHATGEAQSVLNATMAMAGDPLLLQLAEGQVKAAGVTPERAVWQATAEVAEKLRAAGPYVAGRVRDLEDVRDRLVAVLTDRQVPEIPSAAQPSVLVARDLAPADTATLDPEAIVAIVTVEGGPTSHTAILARSLGVPAVVAATEADRIWDGVQVAVDGTTGEVVIDPSPGRAAVSSRPARSAEFSGAGKTADGFSVPLLANLGDKSGLRDALAVGAEGVGLLRTEFCFLDRSVAPDVEEQVGAYREVLEAFPGKRVVVRTLDAGADKPLPFLDLPDEPNPALGVRGYRTSRQRSGLLEDQLRALAIAADGSAAELAVMAPMISTPSEADEFTTLARGHGLPVAGAMIEVPAAALCVDAVLAVCDFVSLGTNDLAQYLMAADRQSAALAGLTDPWQPAVLRLVSQVAEAGARAGKPVGVCGEAAADPALACVLVGLGVVSLSMVPAMIPAVAEQLAATTRATCRDAGRVALSATGPKACRSAVADVLSRSNEVRATE